MSYSIPAYNAVNFDDAGTAYTPPNYNAVDFDDGNAIGGASSFAGAGSLAAVGARLARGAVAFAGVGAFTAIGAELRRGAVGLAGAGSFSAAGRTLNPAAAVFAGAGSFASAGAAAIRGATAFAGVGTFNGTAAAAARGAAALAGSGALSGSTAALSAALVALAGSGSFVAFAPIVAAGAVAFSGAGSFHVGEPPAVVFVIKFSNRGRLLLYEPLPLRTTRMLGNFADDAILPHRYGDLTSGRFELLRLDDSTFFAADHPMTIDKVFVDDQTTPGWAQETRSDSSGNTWTVVVLTAPAPNGARLSATGTGKRNPRTGALIENPADIIEDVLRIAGRTNQWWDQLRAEAAAEGLRLGGSVGLWTLDEPKSIRAVLDEICQSAGAIWAPGMARLYPVTAASGYVAKLDKMKVSKIVLSATIDNTADVLRLSYDPDTAGSRSQHYIELTANPSLYGRIVSERSFDWLRTPQNAETVGKRVLPWLAGERYDVAFDCGDDSIRPGTWVQFVNHPKWPFADENPDIMVLSAIANQGGKTVACTGQTLRTTPAAIVTGHSVAVPVTRDAALEVAVADGVLNIVAKDPSDRPIPGARVNVDGGPEKRTDANGRVSFEATPGQHKVAIQAPGKRTQVLTVEV